MTTPSPEQLGISPEVHWYLLDRGFPLPEIWQRPSIRTPEPSWVEGATFSPERVDKALKAMSALVHTKGKWAGQPLIPDAWQLAYIFAPIFGWVKWDDDAGDFVRIIRTAFVEVPRKNGKTTMSGGIALYMTAADGESGAEVYAAAAAKDQASKLFTPVRDIVTRSPKLLGHFKVVGDKIIHPRSMSYFQVVSNAADLIHGTNPHCAVVDELHVHKSRTLIDNLESGTGARTQPLIVIITTSDDNRQDSAYNEKRKWVEDIFSKVLAPSETYYGVIWAADVSDDPHKEDTWKKANPGYGVSPSRQDLQKASEKAKSSLVALNDFLRTRLGIRVSTSAKYIDPNAWRGCASNFDISDMKGKRCYVGVDLASVDDLSSICVVFPVQKGIDKVRAIWVNYAPERARKNLESRTHGTSRQWVQDGWLKVTEGVTRDDEQIIADLFKICDDFDVQTIGYDRYDSNNIIGKMQDRGIECVGIAQGTLSLNAPMKESLKLVLEQNFEHLGDPCVAWMINNMQAASDNNGNIKPDKKNSPDKIDAGAALMDAMKEMLDNEDNSEVQVF